MIPRDKRFIGIQLGVALSAMALGSLFGPLQALEHAKINLYPVLEPVIASYYQGLTLHGVLNALVFTTFFITAFHTFAILKGLDRPLRWYKGGLAGLVIMIIGGVMATITMLLNQASVLYTFYIPMKASPYFYIGLTLVVVGSWFIGWSSLATIAAWKKEHPGEKTPLIALGSAVNTILWQLSTLGLIAEMLFLVIPWALNLVPATDALLSRVLFWFTGHPLVYFWLLPAYVSWYGMLPKQVGGKLFSDSLARLAFWLFLIFSTPVGFHHQFTDPGIPVAWKYVHTILTFLVVIPSFMTAFTVIASLERAGRAKGGKGLFGWIGKMPWKDPAAAGQLLAGFLFFFGGIGGIINASASLNLVVHNTAFIPGHFHLTVAAAAALTFLSITFWLIPHLTGKPLQKPRLALAFVYTWFAGMTLFGAGMHWLGLVGAPRRVPFSTATYSDPTWVAPQIMTAVGGVLLAFALILYFWVTLATVLGKMKSAIVVEAPIAESEVSPAKSPAWLENWKMWIAFAIILVLIGYGPMLIEMISNINLVSPGFKVW